MRPAAAPIVWSPFSNLWLYGGTTDVLAARAAGLRVCLGSDWTPSGTRNVLGELKVAATWNAESLGGVLTDEDIVEMATANPGDTLAAAVGCPGRAARPGRARRHRRVRQRRLQPVAHRARRDRAPCPAGPRRRAPGLRQPCRCSTAAGVEDAEPVTVAGVRRGLVMTLPDELLPPEPDLQAEATKSWADGLAELAAVWADPGGSVRKARRRRAVGEPVFEFVPDMPSATGDDSRALDEHELDQLVMPTFDSIGHDATWIMQCVTGRRRTPRSCARR